jgi:hypothetical protein
MAVSFPAAVCGPIHTIGIPQLQPMPAFPGDERAGSKNSEAGDAIAIPGLENQSKSLLEG